MKQIRRRQNFDHWQALAETTGGMSNAVIMNVEASNVSGLMAKIASSAE